MVTKAKKIAKVVAPKFVNDYHYKYADLDKVAAESNLKLLRTRAASARKLAQETAVGILVHYAKHGDYTKLPDLYDTVKNFMSVNLATALEKWVKTNSSLHRAKHTDEKGRVTFKFEKKPGTKPEAFGMSQSNFDIAKIECADFWKSEPTVAEIVPIDFNVRLVALLKEAAKLYSETTTGRKIGKDKVVKVAHEHISDKLVADLAAFVKSHGVDIPADIETMVPAGNA